MKKLNTAFVVLCMLSCGIAHASDWKIGGYSTGTKGNATDLFYDAEKVVNLNGTVRFWIKAIDEKKINLYKNDKKLEKSLLEETAKKISTYYSPPILSTSRFKKTYKNNQDFLNASVEGALTETIINNIEIPIEAKVFWEINCINNQIKVIELELYDNKGNISGGKLKEDWTNISPDSNAESWYELFCK